MRNLLRIAAVLAALSGPAWAGSGTLTVAGYAGSFETIVRAEVIPAFEKKFGVRVDYLAGNSGETMARLQEGKGKQPIDIVIADDGPMHQAVRLGLCASIDGLSAEDLERDARFEDDKAVGLGLIGIGLMYNAGFFKEKGWAAPTSWNDLKDSRYRKLIVVPPIGDIYGLITLVMLARSNGGGEKNIDPGFKALKEQVDPNVLTYEQSLGTIFELFRAGKAVLTVSGAGRAPPLGKSELPVEFVQPREGAVTLFAAACPVARANASPLASEFIKAMLEPKLQMMFFKDFGYGPVNRKTVLPPAPAAYAPVAERVSAVPNLDWDTINAHRDEWIRRWKNEIGR